MHSEILLPRYADAICCCHIFIFDATVESFLVLKFCLFVCRCLFLYICDNACVSAVNISTIVFFFQYTEYSHKHINCYVREDVKKKM